MTNNNVTTKYFPLSNPEKVESWGMSHFCESPVYHPKSIDEIKEILKFANDSKTRIVFRGGGCSYGDASIINGGIVVDMQSYNKILNFDESTGIIHAESGTTIKQIWEFAIEKGFWPPVVSGTMHPTLGGALSMNIHGKNNFAVGPLGEHVVEFSFLTGSGETIICSKEKNKELFYSFISGLGMLGCFLEIKLKLKKIYSGKMLVTPIPTKNLKEMFDEFVKHLPSSDYLVGWVDAFATGASLGRGLIHKANNLKEGEDPDFKENIKLKNQILPSTFFGVIPKSWMWMFMYPFSNKLGMRLVNWAKYIVGTLPFTQKVYKQGHAEFAFLLDYVPGWKKIYKPGSMIQYQVFFPENSAYTGMKEIFEHCHKKGMPSFLAVFKRHRKDNFLISHAVDGYSMAMDFPVSPKTRQKVWDMAYELDEIVLKHKGRFYFAKDSVMRPKVAEGFLSKEVVQKIKDLKKKYDPNNILQSDLYSRVFGNK